MHQPPPPLERQWTPEADVRPPRPVGSRLEVRDARRHPLYPARLLGPAIATAVALGGGWHALFQAAAVAWLGWSAWTTVRDRRAASAHPVPLAVGPEGITLAETGRLAWDDIRDLRIRVTWGSDDGSPPVPGRSRSSRTGGRNTAGR
jgi:hypothetical protein